ncbi:unnamed protein product [Ixodes hexagonus]
MASSAEVVAPKKSVDKLKYLEKYMSGKGKKKKKRPKASAVERLRILDDDVDLKQISSAHSREGSPEDEDVPVVAAVVDDRPLHARVAEQYASGQWKTLGKDSSRDVPQSPVQRAGSGIDSDGSPPRKPSHRTRHDSDSDQSPERPAATDTSRKSPKKLKTHQKEGHIRKRTPPPDHHSSPQRGRHDSDSDASPPRKRSSPSKTRRPEKSPEKKQRSRHRNHSPTDTFSSRHGASNNVSSDTKKHKKERSHRHDSLQERDVRPERHADPPAVKIKSEPPDDRERTRSRPKGRSEDAGHASSMAISPGKLNSDSDLSPTRERPRQGDRHRLGRTGSPARSNRRADDRRSHRSPERKRIRVKVEPQSPRLSPKKRARTPSPQRHNSDSDPSPHRARPESSPRGSDSDLSPTRQGRPQRDLPLVKQRDSDSDLSPPRPEARSGSPAKVKRRGSSSDLSPARRRSPGKSSSPPRSKRHESGRGRHARGESSPERRRKEPEKTQEVVKLRDTSKADRAKEAAAKEAERAKVYDKWGKGLAQQEQQTQKLEEHLHEMSKPFSRYEDDADLEKHLKDQEREGDPMLNYIRKKKKKGVENNLPKYSGPEPPPNRYGIRPGYRWDGVDRSNGFEKKLVEMRNNKKATDEIAYKWSVEEL